MKNPERRTQNEECFAALSMTPATVSFRVPARNAPTQGIPLLTHGMTHRMTHRGAPPKVSS
jgi:hypothetical protein